MQKDPLSSSNEQDALVQITASMMRRASSVLVVHGVSSNSSLLDGSVAYALDMIDIKTGARYMVETSEEGYEAMRDFLGAISLQEEKDDGIQATEGDVEQAVARPGPARPVAHP
jgi:hypothetical protein